MASHFRQEILDGIRAELSKAAEYVEFTVAQAESTGTVWKVLINLEEANGFRSGGLDESMEGSRAWWQASPQNGGAEVLSVIPENEQINLRFATCRPPSVGGTIRIYPPRYLEALLDAWMEDEWAKCCLDRYERVEQGRNAFDESRKLPPPPLPRTKLRECQSNAFSLTGWDHGYLWGPPGTGKTTTLGVLLAAYIIKNPEHRVLLLSATNHAVDQAVVSLDTALEEWASKDSRASKARKECARLGSHFLGTNYSNREHLIPVKDISLVRRLVELESQAPDKSDVIAYDLWVRQLDSIRQEIRTQAKEFLENVRVAAMTTTRAIFTRELLRELGSYDLIVFDEASQVGQAHAMALMPLGQRIIFAGDPKQLAPIVISGSPEAQRWLGESMFRDMKANDRSTILLDQQSRMAEPICRIISDVFYDGKLTVATDSLTDPRWTSYRRIRPPSSPVSVEMVAEDGTWSQNFRGPIRYESAMKICEVVADLAAQRDETDILVLTPFRAQRTLIRLKLREAGLGKVRVSTVHRAQGSEQYAIVFDPVVGNNPFLKTPDAPRLVNVALSRAKARLVLCLSPDDFKNPLIAKVVHAIDRQQSSSCRPIEEFSRCSDFPDNALGQLVKINSLVGRVIGTTSHNKLPILDSMSGDVVHYMVDTLTEVCQKKLSGPAIRSSVSATTSPPPRFYSDLSIGEVVECTVFKVNKSGLDVRVNTLRGFLPASHLDLRGTTSMDNFVGRKMAVRIIDVDPQARNLVVSPRAILIEQFEEAATLFWTQVQVGQRYSGTVAAIKDYGAFIDLGGVTGFLHIREMTWTRLKHPLDLLQQWQPVDVVVLSVDRTKQRVSLGMRQLSANPWSGIEKRYPVGNNLVGNVSRTSEFGAFVELEPGIEGLIHISELDHQRVRKVSDVVKVGQKVHVRVLEIQPDRQRISLSLKSLQQTSATDTSVAQETRVHRQSKKGPLRRRLDSLK